MGPFDELIAALAGLVPAAAESAEAQLALTAADLQVDVPLESRIVDGGRLLASLPRGRVATGFDPPLGRMRARFRAEAP